MPHADDIRYRPDGSIDTAFYIARARHLRSCKAHQMMGSTPADTRRAPTRRTSFWG